MTELEDFNTPLLVKILIYYKYASVFIYEKNVFICSDRFFKGMELKVVRPSFQGGGVKVSC